MRRSSGVGLHDLGEHRLKDLSRPMRLHQIVAEGLTADFPPLRTLEYRADEPARASGRRRPRSLDARTTWKPWLVWCASAGIASSRWSARAASARRGWRSRRPGAWLGDFADGARFVALAAVSEFRDLASAIARALAAPVREGEPAQAALVRFLSDRHLLLVLDNFEQLVDGAPLVGDLIGACPELTVLVTSREPTRLAAERLYPGASARGAGCLGERHGDRARAIRGGGHVLRPRPRPRPRLHPG